MNGINCITLIGNLGKDPEIFSFESGIKKARFTLATTEIYKNKTTNERVEHTEWHNIVMYRNLAEIAEKYLLKGNPLYLEGRNRTRVWEDEKGEKHYFTEIEVKRLNMLGGRDSQKPKSSKKTEGKLHKVPKRVDVENIVLLDEEELPF